MTFTFNKQREDTPDISKYLQVNPGIDKESTCETCPLNEKYKPIAPQGKGNKKVLVVFSHPTKDEQSRGALGTSHAFTRMANDLQRVGLDIERDCWYISASRCFPGARVPSKKILDCCRGKLLETVQELKPTTVLLVGRESVYGWIGHQFSVPPKLPSDEGYMHDVAFDTWVGHTIPDHTYSFEVNGIRVCPTVIPLFNPKDVSKMEQNNMVRGSTSSVVPLRHFALLNMVVDIVNRKQRGRVEDYNRYNEFPGGQIIKVGSPTEAIKILKKLNTPSIIAFDYETTGIKPFDKGHAIKMVGISDGNYSYAIPFFSHVQEFNEAYKALMTNPEVKKVAHNAKFEYNWTRKICGFRIQGLIWDTMLVAHILDMRDNITGLKFQSYVKLGLAGYEKVTKKLLASPDKDAKGTNGLNYLQYLYPDDLSLNASAWSLLLDYVAGDAGNTRALYLLQIEQLLEHDYKHLMKGIKLFNEATVSLADMEYNGFTFDYDMYEENKKAIEVDLERLKTDMLNCDEYKQWVEVHPDTPLNVNSSKQKQEFLYEILGYDAYKLTKSGAKSTDKESLEQLDSEYCKMLLEYGELNKMLNTFLKGYVREVNDDGKLRCSFNLNGAKSYRTSSSTPNLQNVPHHSSISKYALNLLKPNKGEVLLNVDYKSLEIFVQAAITKDPMLLTYLMDEGRDMHRDTGGKVHFMKPEELSSRLRFLAKKVNFGTTYGSGAKSLATNQWKDYTKEDKANLKSHGIGSLQAFEDHMKNFLYDFWNVRFKDYGAWRNRTWKEYVENGFILNKMGFIYDGIMSFNQTSNFPIQGAGSSILLETVNYLRTYIEKHTLRSTLIAEVHDSIILSCPPEEVTVILEGLKEYLGTIPGNHSWVGDLDFIIEAECSEIDGSWYSVEPVASISSKAVELLPPSIEIDDNKIVFEGLTKPLDIVTVTKLAKKNKHAFVSKIQYQKLIMDLAGV